MSVAIIGDRGCGKTVFLSLLYDALVEYTNETRGKIRFYTAPEFTGIMGEIVNRMLMQSWPDADLKAHIDKYWFILGYKRNFTNEYRKLKFFVYDIVREHAGIVNELTGTKSGDYQGRKSEILPSALKPLLDCSALVFLIDASKLNATPTSEAFKQVEQYDTLIASIISMAAEYKLKKFHGFWNQMRKVYPVFVLTKFDMIDKKTLAAVGLDKRTKPDPLNASHLERTEYSETLLAKYYRNTFGLKENRNLSNVEFDKCAYFFSAIQTEKDEQGQLVPSTEKGLKVRLRYSIEEYRAFIGYFEKIADKMPDEIKEE